MTSKVEGKSFDPTDPIHCQFLDSRRELFLSKLTPLQKQDYYILCAMISSTASFLGTWIFPLTTLGFGLSTALTTYWLKDRPSLASDYRTTLADMIKTYQWIMESSEDKPTILSNESVIQFVEALGPFLNMDTLKQWTPQELERASLIIARKKAGAQPTQSWREWGGSFFGSQAAQPPENKPDPHPFKKLEDPARLHSLSYLLYGQDGGLDILKAIRTKSTGLASYVYEAVSSSKPSP